MNPGSSVTMSAVVPNNLAQGEFFIQLLKDQLQLYPTTDVLLHIKPLHTDIIFNAKSGGTWGHEEKILNTYFQPGTNFTITIVAQRGYYEIRVDDEFIHAFKYRSDEQPHFATIQGVSKLENMQYHHAN